MSSSDYKKYLYAFIITSAIFATALFLGNYFSDKKLEEMRNTENQISIDILSSETQFALLGDLSCPNGQSPTLSDELNSLGEKLNYSEEKLGSENSGFITLKKQYSLLEIRDYLLTKKLKDCPNPPTAILYFYKSDCSDCDKEGYVLTYLRGKYPSLRVYSFDYNLDLSALKTLAQIYGVKDTLPAIVIKNKSYIGFKSIDDIKAILPELKDATTTEAVTGQ